MSGVRGLEDGALLRPSLIARWFGPDRRKPGYLVARWFVLRSLGGIYLSVFYSLACQIHGLIGPGGILPAGEYLEGLGSKEPGVLRFWLAARLLVPGVKGRSLGF